MQRIITALALAIPLATVTLGAEAKGCLKGAAVGGTAGHFAGHHAVLGAAAGCVVEHHREKVRDRNAAQQAQPVTNTAPPATPTVAR